MNRAILAATLLCCSSFSIGQDLSAFDLLLDKLTKLEQRVEILEQQKTSQSNNPDPSQVNTVLASDVRLWRQNVKLGMTLEQIRAIYGDPVKRIVSGSIEIWSYATDAITAGSPPSVSFSDGKVLSHDEPD